MKLISAASIACAALLSPHVAQAQSNNDYNQNVTLRFFTSSQADSCDYANTTSALTFTTVSIPSVGKCFNVADLFGGNATSGLNGDIRWQLLNKDKYDPSANYSSLLYRQHVERPNDDRYEVGAYADRHVNLYGGANCSELDSNNMSKPLLPWFGLNCWGEGRGECGDTPYNIKSFYVLQTNRERSGKCWDFAYMGAAGNMRVGEKVVFGIAASVLVAVLEAW